MCGSFVLFYVFFYMKRYRIHSVQIFISDTFAWRYTCSIIRSGPFNTSNDHPCTFLRYLWEWRDAFVHPRRESVIIERVCGRCVHKYVHQTVLCTTCLFTFPFLFLLFVVWLSYIFGQWCFERKRWFKRQKKKCIITWSFLDIFNTEFFLKYIIFF